MRVHFLVAAGLAALTLAGCLGASETDDRFPYFDTADGKVHFEFDHADGRFHFDWAPGAIGKAWNQGDAPVEVTLPHGFLLVSGDQGASGSFSLPGPFVLEAGQTQWFLAPPKALDVELVLDGEAYLLDAADAAGWSGPQDFDDQIVSGENVYDLEALQHERFPNREPGHPNYQAAIAYFDEYFQDLGYMTEVDPYGTQDASQGGLACLPVRGGTICPESLANVVAWKEGTTDPEKIIFVSGGHFDMVSGTTHAAFDDTSGTVSTLELARAMAPYEFGHTIMFGLWGGEENGILGSQFWVQSNPEARANVLSYWNLDVVGMSWPAPLPRPDPVVIAAGPDTPGGTSGEGAGPVAESLLDWARTLQTEWFGFPDQATSPRDGDTYDVFLYEGIASGQVAGYAGVNAQSDHTPFAAAGIPAYFIFNGDTLAADNPIGIHNERDTLWNMTKYAYYADEFDLDDPSWPDEATFTAAKEAIARSWETVLYFPFYHALLVDLGMYGPPGAADAS